MKPIDVKICLGTTCFVMGAGYLQGLSDSLPKTYGDKVNASCVRCLGICNKADNFSKAPYVAIDDEIISEATPEKIIEILEGKLNNG